MKTKFKMEQIDKAMQKLASQLFLTNSENEDEKKYVLTSEEEESCIQHAIADAKNHLIYRMRNANANSNQIEARLKHTDWDKVIDRDKILMAANASKLQGLWHDEQRKKEKEAQKAIRAEIEKRCDANYMFKLMKSNCKNKFGKDLIFNKQTEPLIKTLCYFFSNDVRFSSELKLDDSKGLLLRGACGLGKSFLVQLLAANERRGVNIISMLDVADSIKSTGVFVPDASKALYIDDVGTEESEIVFYGTRINWFREFMEKWYMKRMPFNKLIFSTNNNFEELQNKYGFRVRSRFKEMFNIIDVDGEDLRK